MQRLQPLAVSDAPAASQPLLEGAQKKLGRIPNLFAALAVSPVALQSYFSLGEVLGKGAFTPRQRELIALAAAEVNECGYCTAAHSAIGGSLGIETEALVGARTGQLADASEAALVRFTNQVIASRGAVSDADLQAFVDAGFSDEHVAELIANVAVNTLTNYFNRAARTEVDFPAAPELQRA